MNIGKLTVQEVTPRMRKCCSNCGDLPTPVRLVQTIGTGKWQKHTIYCVDCGYEKLGDLQNHLEELRGKLPT